MELLVNPGGNADAIIAAKALANQNVIWSQAAGDSNINVSVPEPCPDGSPTGCISVWVMRGLPDQNNAAHTNTFPTFMMGIVGATTKDLEPTLRRKSQGPTPWSAYVRGLSPTSGRTP